VRLPQDHRGTRRPGHHRRPGHRLGHPQEARHRPRTPPHRTTWADFLRSQTEAIIACDFFTVDLLDGTKAYVLAVIEHATRRIRILGATAHPTNDWVVQQIRNLVMDLDAVAEQVKFLIRDRDILYPPVFDAVLTDTGIRTVKSAARAPHMKSIMERWIGGCRRELLDRTLVWNLAHLAARCAGTRRTTTNTGPTWPCTTPPRPSRHHPKSPTSRHSEPDDMTESAESSTNINRPPDPPGWGFRQPQPGGAVRLDRSTTHPIP
jgi:hypothetical protein